MLHTGKGDSSSCAHVLVGPFTGPRIFSLFNSLCLLQQQINRISFRRCGFQWNKERKKVSVCTNRCWHLLDDVRNWMGFRPDINPRLESVFGWYWSNAEDLSAACRPALSDSFVNAEQRGGGGVCVRRCHLPSFHILTFWDDTVNLAQAGVWVCVCVYVRVCRHQRVRAAHVCAFSLCEPMNHWQWLLLRCLWGTASSRRRSLLSWFCQRWVLIKNQCPSTSWRRFSYRETETKGVDVKTGI